MATLINNSSGNFTTAATWSLVDSTSFSNSEAASTASTTSWVASQSFVPGAITVDGLAIKVAAHTTVGNIGVKLGKNGAITAISIANPTQVTSANHGLTTGEAVLIAGTNSTPALTGPYTVTVLDGNTFTVPVNVTVAGTTGTWKTVLANIASNTLVATPVFTTTVAHGLTAGTSITIRGSTATPSFNGTWVVATTPTVTTFTLTGAPSAVGGVSGWGAYNIVGVPDTLVVVAASDFLTVNTATNNGFCFFKFPSSITLTTGTTYTIQISGSTAGNITSYRTATAGDWSRALRTTTTQAPASGDGLLVMGDHTSPGVGNSYTVTNDNTTTTTWGDLEVSCAGTFAYGTAASTNYYFKISNSPTIYTGGILNIGTIGSPMPASSTGKLEIVCSSNVQFGLEIRSGAMVSTGGNVITNTAKLAADASASSTSLTTDVSTGWKNGDVIAIASTTRTRTECESKALTADASGTTLTITALTNAHGGTAPIVAELANLTRNVSIFSSSTSNQTYVNIVGGSIVDFESTEFYNMGSATALKRGIDVGTTVGSCIINNCSIHDFNVASSVGINCNSAANNNLTISNNNIYNTASICLNVVATTGTNSSFSNILGIFSGASVVSFADLGNNISNITAVGGATRGMLLSEAGTAAFGTMSGFIAHSNTGPGIDFTNYTGFGYPYTTFLNNTSWRNTTYGIVISNTFDIIVDTCNLFGNTTANIGLTSSTGNVFIRNATSNAGTTLTCPIGVAISADIKETYIDNSTFGVTTMHATGDSSVTSTNLFPHVIFRNCILNSTTQVANPTTLIDGGTVGLARLGQINGNHKTFQKFGTIQSDSVIYNTGPISTRMTPNNASFKLMDDLKKIAVPSGQTARIKVFIRKSVVGDGTAYNGNQVRLMLKADPATGVNSDTVLASTDNTFNGVFQQLTATTPAISDNAVFQVYIDCDGTTGWINIDNWSVG